MSMSLDNPHLLKLVAAFTAQAALECEQITNDMTVEEMSNAMLSLYGIIESLRAHLALRGHTFKTDEVTQIIREAINRAS